MASQHGFVRVVPAPDLPAGWTGKTWACHTGASVAAHGGADTLIFLDADVRVADGALDSVLAARRERGGVVSVQPRHVVRSAYERLSAIFNVVSMAGTGAGWPRPTGLFGPVAHGLFAAVGTGGQQAVEDRERAVHARRHQDVGDAIGVIHRAPLVGACDPIHRLGFGQAVEIGGGHIEGVADGG